MIMVEIVKKLLTEEIDMTCSYEVAMKIEENLSKDITHQLKPSFRTWLDVTLQMGQFVYSKYLF